MVEGDNLFGDGVNVAARLEGLSRPGEVCVSRTVFDHVKAKVDIGFEDLGERQLKNIAEPVQIYRVKPDDGDTRHPDLRTVGEDLALPEKPSIAILPFKNLSGDIKLDYLAEGFRLDIQAALIKVSGLFLIATGTVNSYRDKDVTAEQAGREMGVHYVLSGGIRKLGDRIRITAQLTDSVAQQIIWAEHYDRSLDDASTLQDDVAAQVFETLEIKLLAGEEARVFQNTLTNLEARDSFYQGLKHGWTMTKDGNIAAQKMYERVTQLQPDSPVGPTYLSFAYWTAVFRGWAVSKEQSLAQAVQWAEKALEFEGTNGLAHVVIAHDHLMNHRYDEALATGYKAVELRPNCPTANSMLANILLYCGHATEAVANIKKAIRISPIYPPWFVNVLAAAYRGNGDIGGSISVAKKSIKISPSDIEARLILCSDYYLADQREKAASVAQEIVAIDPQFSVAKYAESQPYKDQETLSRLVENLRGAGLPE
jgi:TolB-like protein